jgi:hypothetical protein
VAVRPDADLRRMAQDRGAAAAQSKLARYRNAYRAHKPDVLRGDPERGIEALPFVWRLLNGQEKQDAMSAAVARLDGVGIPLELMGSAELEDELSWQILARAMRDPDVQGELDRDPYPVPLAADVDELRQRLTTDERDDLRYRYLDFEEENDRAPRDLSAEEMLAIERVAKKKPSESLAQLMSFGTRSLALYLRSSVARLSPSASGSSGSSTESSES